MPTLADLQADVGRALRSGDVTALASALVGGTRPLLRIAIHQRHFEASLINALLGKFPATSWLIGSEAVAHAARRFVRAHPPARPCIAEYGEDFPAFLVACHSDVLPPYVRSFGELEWQVGQVAIAISEPPAAWSDLMAIGPDAVPHATLRLQPGLRYLHATYAVDDLVKLYLAGSEPEQFTLADGDVRIQVRGARGEVGLTRLDAPTFMFRSSVLAGRSLGEAVEQALRHDGGFDTSSALRTLVAEGLVRSIEPRTRGDA